MLPPATLHFLESIWATNGLLACGLRFLAWVYGHMVTFNQWLYRHGLRPSHQLRIPVVVVGNVVAGGAGKTPTVIAVVHHLQRQGWSVGVISRGYGRQTQQCLEVKTSSDPNQVGDEPLLIAMQCQVPVFVAPRRIDAARALLHHYPTTHIIVSDDGLQHYALQRDIDIVVFDDRGLGNARLLPAGWLRECWPRHYTANTTFLLHPAEAKEQLTMTNSWVVKRTLASTAVNGQGEKRLLSDFVGTRVAAFAAIARPETFFTMLQAQGIQLHHCTALPDHFDFTHWDLPNQDADLPIEAYLCTEKDAVKVWRQFPNVWAIALELQADFGFFASLDRSLKAIAARNDHHDRQHEQHPTTKD